MGETLALVGATGGAGTTRLTVEFGAILARTGRSVALLDAAYATQGLSGYVNGRIDPDMTLLVNGDGPLESGLVDLELDLPGRVAACPAVAPFTRIAAAKTAGAAQRLGTLLSEAGETFDYAIVDTPPVAANQAVGAVDAADRIAIVTPDSERGADAYALLRDRFADLGVAATMRVRNHAVEDGVVGEADVGIPESEVVAPSACPVSTTGEGPFTRAVATAVERTFDLSLDLGFEQQGGLQGYLPARLRSE